MKNETETRDASQINIKRFAVIYVLMMGAFLFLIGFKPVQDIIDLNGVYTKSVVAVTSKILNVMKIPCTVQGSIIKLPAISLDVKFGCNGLEAVMIYSVAVIAFPAPWRKKLTGIAAGFVVIQVINIIRIATLAYSGVHFKSFFEYIHIYVAQGIMIAVSLAIFFIYLNYTKPQKTSAV